MIRLSVRVCIVKPLFTVADAIIIMMLNKTPISSAFKSILLSLVLLTPRAPVKQPSTAPEKATILAVLSLIMLIYTSSAPIKRHMHTIIKDRIVPFIIPLKFIFPPDLSFFKLIYALNFVKIRISEAFRV